VRQRTWQKRVSQPFIDFLLFHLSYRLLLDCLADCRVQLGALHQDEDLGARMRQVVVAAGGSVQDHRPLRRD